MRSVRSCCFVVLAGVAAVCAVLVASAAADRVTDAARRGDKAAVKQLLESGADVNGATGDGMTALHWAAQNGAVDLAKMLLFAGANVRATTRLGGYTPLLMAASNGDAAMIQTLVDGGANPAAANSNGTTPLMLAAVSGRVDAVAVLIQRGADVNAKEHARGETALMFAAANGRVEAIRVLTAHGGDVKATTRVLDVSAFSKEMADAAGPPAPRSATASGTIARDAQGSAPASPRAGRAGRGANQRGGIDRRYLYNELVSTEGGMTALLLAARQGELESVKALLDSGADINQAGAGDHTTPLLIAAINGRFDLARFLLAHGADPRIAAANGVTPLYAVINCRWAQKALYPQPRAFEQQTTGYLDLMNVLLDKGADPNVRVRKKVWYSGYNSDFSSIDEEGATVFWRAAYAADVDAMKLLVARGADPNIPTSRVPGRNRNGGGLSDDPVEEVSTKPPIPVGGPAMAAIHAASGPGYGEGFAGNAHRYAPGGLLPAVKYLVEELHADVNVEDQDGNTPLHNAAARGDNEMILYLVSKGADVKAVNREGKTTVDMANGPVQRVQPFPETIALLEKLGAKNNHKCISC
jgi:ankyrin repeat protein